MLQLLFAIIILYSFYSLLSRSSALMKHCQVSKALIIKAEIMTAYKFRPNIQSCLTCTMAYEAITAVSVQLRYFTKENNYIKCSPTHFPARNMQMLLY